MPIGMYSGRKCKEPPMCTSLGHLGLLWILNLDSTHQERQGPKLKDYSRKYPRVDGLAQETRKKDRKNADYNRRNGQKVRLGSVKSKITQREGEICLGRADGHHMHKS